jgi:hypothetical protein
LRITKRTIDARHPAPDGNPFCAGKVYEALAQRISALNEFPFGDRGFNEMKVVELVPGKRVKGQCVSGVSAQPEIAVRNRKGRAVSGTTSISASPINRVT